MEQPKCNNCESKKFTVYLSFTNPNANIVSCDECGLMYLTPQPKKEAREDVYNEFYFKREVSKNKNVSGYRSYREDQYIHNFYFSKILKKINRYKKRRAIFEIGSAMGFFLDIASQQGFEAEGIEISKYCVDFGKNELNLNIQKTDFSQYKTDKRFDVVALFQTLEHLPDPKSTLKKINKILKNNGIVIITTPNQKSLISKLFGKKWFEYKPTEHLFYYNPQSISYLLRDCNFDKIKVTRDLHYLSIEYILERIRYYVPIFFVLVKPLEKIAALAAFNKTLVPFDKGSMLIIAHKVNNEN